LELFKTMRRKIKEVIFVLFPTATCSTIPSIMMGSERGL
jgi:hypothetical protein